MSIMGDFIIIASHGQTFWSSPATPGGYLFKLNLALFLQLQGKDGLFLKAVAEFIGHYI